MRKRGWIAAAMVAVLVWVGMAGAGALNGEVQVRADNGISGVDVSGSTVNLGSIGTAATNASLQCIAPAAANKSAYSAVSGSSTTVDAGCTGNVALYMKATNLSRTYDVKFTGPDGGVGRIPPSGIEFFCKAGSATADSVVFDATCDTCNAGRVSVTAGCVN